MNLEIGREVEGVSLGDERLNRRCRTALVEVRAGRVALQAPYRRTGKLPNMTVGVVWVREHNPPAGIEPLDWLLITSLPIESRADVLRVVEYDAARWTIEVFFRVLKTGCKVEDIPLETAARLLPCLMLYRIVAWRVMYVTMPGRECPELPCDALFTDAEWKSVYKIVRNADPPSSAPSLKEFTLMLGELGGHNGRKARCPSRPADDLAGNPPHDRLRRSLARLRPRLESQSTCV